MFYFCKLPNCFPKQLHHFVFLYSVLNRLFLLFSHSVMPDSVILWNVARQAPLSMGFPRQEYWGGLPFPSPGDLPDPGIKPVFPAWQGGFFALVACKRIRLGLSRS